MGNLRKIEEPRVHRIAGSAVLVVSLTGLWAGCANTSEVGALTSESFAGAVCEGGNRVPDSLTIVAAAPPGIGEQHLGRPVTRDFRFLTGPAGESLFPEGTIRTTPVNTMQHRTVVFEDSNSLSANASGWIGLFGGGVSASSMKEKRYAAYEAFQLKEVREIDETTRLRAIPQDAVFFIWRIQYGHSYDVVVSGSTSSFNAGVRASYFTVSGAIDKFAAANNLSVAAFGRGLTPISGQAIFAREQSQIETSYRASGEAVPIYVEYRSIPNACVPTAEDLRWIEPVTLDVNFDKLRVYKVGSSGRDTWSLTAKCRVNDKEMTLGQPAIWDRQSNVCGDEIRGQPRPGGSSTTYCEYNLGWTTRLQAMPGDTVRCSVQGMAWDRQKPVELTEAKYVVKPDGNVAFTGNMGADNGDTEYQIYYSFGFPQNRAP